MILITGGTGHTGSRLVYRLVQMKQDVRVLSREPVRLSVEIRRQISVVRGNLLNPEDAEYAACGCDSAIAMTHIKFAPHVIAALKSAGIRRAIFTSSTRRFTKFLEQTARQVIAGEQAVRESGLDWTILRPSMIYGGKLDNNIELLVRFMKICPVQPLVNGGKMKWQPVFTWDVVKAVLAALERPETIGKEYTLAGPEPITYREMIQVLLDEMHRHALLVPVPLSLAKFAASSLQKVIRKSPVRLDQLQRLEEDKTFDISDARRELGFEPISFREGIRRKLSGTA